MGEIQIRNDVLRLSDLSWFLKLYFRSFQEFMTLTIFRDF